MKKSASYEDYLIDELKDPQEAADYLDSALEEGDIKIFLLALQRVIKAQGGIAKVAEKAHKNRNSLYKTLSEQGNPYLKNVKEILSTIGLRLAIQRNKLVKRARG